MKTRGALGISGAHVFGKEVIELSWLSSTLVGVQEGGSD